MNSSAVRITAEGQMEPCAVDQALTGSREGAGPFWISVAGYEVDELEAWLQPLDLTPFARNRLLNQGEITKVVPVPKGILLDLRVLPAAGRTGPSQIALLRLDNLVVQFDPEAGPDTLALDARLGDFELMEASSTGILLSILLLEAKRVSRGVREIRAAVFELDERMDRDSGGVSQHEILVLKDRLMRLFAVAEEQLDSFDALTAPGNERLDFSSLRGTVHLLSSVAGFSERMAERLEKRIADLRQRYDGHQQEKLNHRLAVLTMVSAIFLPLTLVAGIWGMNFEEMPELSNPLGYPAALALMALLVGGMLWFFRRKGWFE